MGPIEKPTRFVIKINEYMYNIHTIVKGIDLCFKTYFALNAEHPRECEQVFMFLQKHIYELNTDHDTNFVSVTAVKSDIDAILIK